MHTLSDVWNAFLKRSIILFLLFSFQHHALISAKPKIWRYQDTNLPMNQQKKISTESKKWWFRFWLINFVWEDFQLDLYDYLTKLTEIKPNRQNTDSGESFPQRCRETVLVFIGRVFHALKFRKYHLKVVKFCSFREFKSSLYRWCKGL